MTRLDDVPALRDRIEIGIADHVAHVRMVRSAKMNALDPAMFAALEAAGSLLLDRRDIRAAVLSGEGRAFCAGLDLGNFDAMAQGEPGMALIERTHGIANLAQHVAVQWRDLPVPVVAAVHGVAFGGGLQLMVGADIRIVHPETQLSVMEIAWGLVPDMGAMWLLRDLVRPDLMAELVYSGRIFSGSEALSLGLATRVSEDPVGAALALARTIASHNPAAIRAAKRIMTIADQDLAARILDAESREQQALLSTPNQIEAILAAKQRRTPVFDD